MLAGSRRPRTSPGDAAPASGARQLELIAGRVADTLQEMKLNQVGSPKSHRLLQDGVIEPFGPSPPAR